LMAGLAFLGPSAGAALGGMLSGRLAASRPPVLVMGSTSVAAALGLAVLAAAGDWVVYLSALTVCGFTLGLVYAFTTVATQAVVRPERAGEAAGVTLTALVTLAGVGVAVSGTVLEMLERTGMSTGSAIDLILAVLAALLLPAGAAVLLAARRAPTEPARSASSRPVE
jgi:MFS family permease